MDWLTATADWMELRPGLAAWLQAVGGTAAVVAAVYLPWAQRRNERRLQSYMLATTISPELMDLKARIFETKRLLEEATLSVNSVTPRVMAEPDSQLVARLILPVPPVMAASLHQLYLLGHAGGEVQRLITALGRFTTMVRDNAERWGSIDPEELQGMLAVAEKQVDLAAVRVDHVRQGRIL